MTCGVGAAFNDAMTRTPRRVPIALVEDHEGTRAALASDLRDFASRVELVATFSNAEAFLASGSKATVDVALVDLGLPGMSGSALIRTLGEAAPAVRALALTAFDDEANVFEAIRAGAYGYLLKDEPTERLVSAIEEAVAGAHPVSSRVTGFLILGALRAAPPVALSDREEELARAFAEGLSYAECAARMGISVGTVQDYVKRLYRKLDVSSKKEVREWVARHVGGR